ncbi:hypothetical protein HKT18_13705 [Flavobacterium sp. IMCC34852]|uniref:Uncharacterized protein n=1 Tax=Flavobacterium rivulicola TaxID=2732161 RepID=A0A7Y3RBV0_9FLAO|nr:hypothetical protein [Flavobacterium sp. IMCC34852]NNT73270.1 hypothetical protein [Flavobacterium sp. IMCC34852]
MKPKFPIISIYNNAVDLIPNQTYLSKAKVLGVLKGNSNSIAFDSAGNKWSFKLTSDKISDNFITRFLANTFYNPTVDVIPEWKMIGEFEIDEIKSVLIKSIEKDEDVLTQFIDSEDIKNHVNKAHSFETIYNILNRYVFEYNEEEI